MTRVFGRLLSSLILAAVTVAANASEDEHRSRYHAFVVESVYQGLEHPWSLAFLPDGRMLVTERPGRLNLIDPESGQRQTLDGVPEVAAVGQGGLLDVALHPEFGENRWVYLSYAAAGKGGYATHVGRGRLQGSALNDFQVLFVATPFTGTGRHFGSRLLFDRKGFLFVTVGDRGERERAQRLDQHQGSVIRLHDDGRVPADNPFAGRDDANLAIYSYGHRNPQGLALHPDTGRIWLHEHGPRGGDEINLPLPGRNYGWPLATYGREYYGPRIGPEHAEGTEPPIHHWTPSIAPSGMAFYDGDAFPNWRGDLFVGALAHTHLQRVRLDGERVIEQERLLDDAGWRIRDVRNGPDGALYLLVDGGDAPVLRLRAVE